jgi:hypothetical protein
MPKCDHLEECDDCAKKIPEKPSEHIARIQQILVTLEGRREQLHIARSNESRYKLSIESGLKEHRKAVEAAETSLEQTRVQLVAELRKADPMFVDLSVPESVNA